MRIDYYNFQTELVNALPLAVPYHYYTLYAVQVPGTAKGDVLQAHAQFELTNDLGFNVMLAHAMVVTTAPIPNGPKPTGIAISPYAGENITPGMHHAFRTLCGSMVVNDPGDVWVNVIVYAASTAAKSGDKLTVNKGYGGLAVSVFRQ